MEVLNSEQCLKFLLAQETLVQHVVQVSLTPHSLQQQKNRRERPFHDQCPDGLVPFWVHDTRHNHLEINYCIEYYTQPFITYRPPSLQRERNVQTQDEGH